MQKKMVNKIVWYLFDAGNSAHALFISTVGFSLYFKQVLFKNSSDSDSLWAILTAIVLSLSGLFSPVVSSWFSFKRQKSIGLWIFTIGCVLFTIFLSVNWGIFFAILCYLLSAFFYYISLPIYSSLIENVSSNDIETTSATGWSLGYLGGIISLLIAFLIGLLKYQPADRPEVFRMLFVFTGVFNLVLSLPLLIKSRSIENDLIGEKEDNWRLGSIFKIVKNNFNNLRLLLSYWMVGECGTIIIYFTAIFLAQYANMSAIKILYYTVIAQAIGALSTWAIGRVSKRIGNKKVFVISCLLWTFVPILLWLITIGVSYWYALIVIGLVIGSHHTIIRSEIAIISIVSNLTRSEKGSLFGFLEITGRITSVLGPLIIAIFTILFKLSYAILFCCVFPLIALVIIRKYKWAERKY